MSGGVGTAGVVTVLLAIVLAATVELLRVDATLQQASAFLRALGHFFYPGLTQGIPLALGIAGTALLGRLGWGRWLGLLAVLGLVATSVLTIVQRGFDFTPQAVVAYGLVLITGFLLIRAKPGT